MMSEVAEPDFIEMPPEALPLDSWHRAKGARMVAFAGYHMPIQYEGIIAEHLWTRSSAGLFDVSHMGQLLVSGVGLDAALEALLPIDLATLKLGMQRYSLLMDEAGGVLDDLMVSRWPDALYMVVNGATKWDDIAHLREHLPDEITLSHLDDRALLALQGPKAIDALARHTTGEWPLESLVFMRFGHFQIAGVEAAVSRSGYTGEDGFEISIAADKAVMIADLLCSEPEVKPIGLGARDSLRLEAGLPLYGHDLDPSVSAIGGGLGFAIPKRRRADGGFMGHARVLGEATNGPTQKRVGLAIEGRQPVREGATIHLGGATIGRVTSGGFSPSLERPIAMGWVDAAHAASGIQLELEQRGKRIAATVVPMPFVPHNYIR
jgi:aminomethyltransferase